MRIIILALILAGCATGKHTEQAMSTWVGHSVSELVSSWGPPSSSISLPEGNTVYSWDWHSSYTMPGQSTTNVATNPLLGTATATTINTGGNTVPMDCQKSFTVNKSGKVTAYSYRGNYCK